MHRKVLSWTRSRYLDMPQPRLQESYAEPVSLPNGRAVPKLGPADVQGFLFHRCLDVGCESALVTNNQLQKPCESQHGNRNSFQVMQAG